MLLAAQAKQVADLVELKVFDDQCGDLSSEILRHAQNGCYKLTTHLPLIDRVVKELKLNGYFVEEQEEGYFQVSWSEQPLTGGGLSRQRCPIPGQH